MRRPRMFEMGCERVDGTRRDGVVGESFHCWGSVCKEAWEAGRWRTCVWRDGAGVVLVEDDDSRLHDALSGGADASCPSGCHL